MARNKIAYMPKIHKSPIIKIAYDTFNTGAGKHAILFTKSRNNLANYIQRSFVDEGFLVAQVIHTGAEQTITMPAAAGVNNTDAVVVRTEQVGAIARRCANLNASTRRGFAT